MRYKIKNLITNKEYFFDPASIDYSKNYLYINLYESEFAPQWFTCIEIHCRLEYDQKRVSIDGNVLSVNTVNYQIDDSVALETLKDTFGKFKDYEY